MLLVEVQAVEYAAVRPHEAHFNRVGVDQVELAPHHDTAARLLGFLYREITIFKRKHVRVLLHHPIRKRLLRFWNLHWEDFLFVLVVSFRLIISEHKNIATCRVPMHITIEINVTTVQCAPHHLLGVKVHWVVSLVLRGPLSIQVGAHQATTIVANYYAVRVLHRYNFEYKAVS